MPKIARTSNSLTVAIYTQKYFFIILKCSYWALLSIYKIRGRGCLFFFNEWNCILSLFESRQKKLWRKNLIRLFDNPKKVNFDIYQLVLQRLSSFTIFHPSSLRPLTEESIPYRPFFQGSHSQIMSRSLPGSDIPGRSRNRKSSEVYAYVGLCSFSKKHARATSEGELATILNLLT